MSDKKKESIKKLIDQFRVIKKDGHLNLLSELKLYIETLISQNTELRNELKNWNSESEIKKLKQEIESLRVLSLYTRSNKERESEHLFKVKHGENCDGSLLYEFGDNGIGSWYHVECKKCGLRTAISDPDSW